MNYGLPYKGSKNKLAERIVDLLPKRTHLIDLFCGGCAVSHAALLRRKFKHIHINDLNWMCPTLFIDALNGKYENDTRWISREDFFRLRDTDPFVAIVWSFGNNMRDYLYSVEIEPLKRAIHYAVFFDDYEPGLALGYDFSFTKSFVTHQQKYAAIRRFFVASKKSDSTLLPEDSQTLIGGGYKHFQVQSSESLFRLREAASRGNGEYRATESFLPISKKKRPAKMQNMEGLYRCRSIGVSRENTSNSTHTGGGIL